MKANLLRALISLLWIGMIVAIGMESVVKFQAESLTKPVAFDVGRVVFSAFNKLQCGLFILLAIACIKAPRLEKVLIAGIAFTLLLQVIWLFPALSHRVDLILAAQTPPPTYQHGLYGALELSKLSLLMMLSYFSLKESLKTATG